jgi:hypothetical protein
VIVFSRELIDSIDVERCDTMLLVNRQVKGFTIDLAGAGEDDLYVWVVVATGFEECKLSSAIQFQVALRIKNRFQVTDVASEIEDVIHAANEVVNHIVVVEVGTVNVDAVFEIVNIKKITALLW